MSLKRLVVPRVAPKLEELVAVEAVALEGVAAGRLEAGVPVYRRPRSLRLPRICGAINRENFSA